MGCRAKLGGLKVLLVEDEARLAELLKEAIGDYFASFRLAHDGIEGLKAFREHRPDILVTDITMPGMTGLELARRVRAEWPETPVVILSAYSDKEKLLGAIDVGVVKYFIKPFDPEELLEYLCSLAQKLSKSRWARLMEPFELDEQSGRLYRKGVLVHLSERESRFLTHLYRSEGHYLENDAIKKLLWPGEEASDERLRTFIRRLRKKSDKALVENVAGQGYVLRVEGEK